MKPAIVYEDAVLLVINKPSGMTVNRADTTRGEETLQDWIEKDEQRAKSLEQRADEQSDFVKRAGIVHRLDKETSGVILAAKTEEAFLALQAQFKERTVHKQYIALVHGEVKPESGEINVPVGRQEWNRMRFGVVAGGKEAQTEYRTISNFKFKISNEKLTLLELEPKTGRTHQIRVHMKYLGYPLFADFLYAGRKTQRDDRKYLSRVFLHAAKIHFRHPVTSEEVHFASELPEELQKFLDTYTDVVK
jgi:23S rRNA pseudouridine1911/1915/1917 synthase